MSEASKQHIETIKSLLLTSNEVQKIYNSCKFINQNRTHTFIPNDPFQITDDPEDIDQLILLTKCVKIGLEKINPSNKVIIFTLSLKSKAFEHNFCIFMPKFQVYILINFFEVQCEVEEKGQGFWADWVVIDIQESQSNKTQSSKDLKNQPKETISDLGAKYEIGKSSERLRFTEQQVLTDFGVNYDELEFDEKKFIFLSYSKTIQLHKVKSDVSRFLVKFKPLQNSDYFKVCQALQDSFETHSFRVFYLQDGGYRRQLVMELKGTASEPLFVSAYTLEETKMTKQGVMFAINSRKTFWLTKDKFLRSIDDSQLTPQKSQSLRSNIVASILSNCPTSRPTKNCYLISEILETFGWQFLFSSIKIREGRPTVEIDDKVMIFENIDNIFNPHLYEAFSEFLLQMQGTQDNILI